MKKHLRIIKIGLPFYLSAALISGCGKDNPKGSYIARVDDSYLTQNDLTAELDSSAIQSSRKQEFIRNWIEKELLYRAALDGNIADQDEYKELLERSKKEIAGVLFLKKYFEENKPEIKPGELRAYFNIHKNEYKLFEDSFLYNIIIFGDEERAIRFRSILMESGWDKTSNVFRGDKSVISETDNKISPAYKMENTDIYRVLTEMNPGEVSIILNPEPKQFAVVQLIKKYYIDEIPEFEMISSQVEERYLMIKRQQMLKNYMKSLYRKHKVVIR